MFGQVNRISDNKCECVQNVLTFIRYFLTVTVLITFDLLLFTFDMLFNKNLDWHNFYIIPCF